MQSADVVGDDGNQYRCCVCGQPGEIICCDGCPRVFHAACFSAYVRHRTGLVFDPDAVLPIDVTEEGGSTAVIANAGKQNRAKRKRKRRRPGSRASNVSSANSGKKSATDALPSASSTRQLRQVVSTQPAFGALVSTIG